MPIYKILIVFPPSNDDVADLLRDTLETQVKLNDHQVVVHQARHETGAWDRLRQSKYDLIITDLYLPKDKNSGLKEEEQLGLTLLQELEKEKTYKKIPKIFVVPRKEVKLYEAVQNFYWTKIVSYEDIDNFQFEILKLIKQALSLKTPSEKLLEHEYNKYVKLFGDIDIFLDPDKIVGDAIEGLFIIKTGNYSYPPQRLFFKRDKFETLIEQSDELMDEKDYGKWEKKLRRIGLDLYDEMFSNEIFQKHFNQLKGMVVRKKEDIRNIRIKFNITKGCHSILFEAFLEDPEAQFWMLRAPIYRGLYIEGISPTDQYKRLFEGHEHNPLNCLIIQADTQGHVANMKCGEERDDLLLDRLFHLKDECDWLEHDFFPRLQQQGLVQTVRKIAEQPGQDFYATVISALEECTWHLIHYAGHSVYGQYKQGKETGYLIFPDPNGLIVKAIEFFCMHLRHNIGFIYLSSCRSAGSEFVFEMANHKVPAIVGFRWDIEDSLAFQFTKTFYEYLFTKKSLETAFLESRRAMYEYDRESRIWAAPILIIQTPQC